MLKEQNTNIDRASRIRDLNDSLRRSSHGGMIVVTHGIASLPTETGRKVYQAVAEFTAFDTDNDPWGEHDCATLSVGDQRIIWKIDYYDRSRRYLSTDPSDPKLTLRVLTVMLASEY